MSLEENIKEIFKNQGYSVENLRSDEQAVEDVFIAEKDNKKIVIGVSYHADIGKFKGFLELTSDLEYLQRIYAVDSLNVSSLSELCEDVKIWNRENIEDEIERGLTPARTLWHGESLEVISEKKEEPKIDIEELEKYIIQPDLVEEKDKTAGGDEKDDINKEIIQFETLLADEEKDELLEELRPDEEKGLLKALKSGKKILIKERIGKEAAREISRNYNFQIAPVQLKYIPFYVYTYSCIEPSLAARENRQKIDGIIGINGFTGKGEIFSNDIAIKETDEKISEIPESFEDIDSDFVKERIIKIHTKKIKRVIDSNEYVEVTKQERLKPSGEDISLECRGKIYYPIIYLGGIREGDAPELYIDGISGETVSMQ